MEISSMTEYQKNTLALHELDKDPIRQFSLWFAEAKKVCAEPEAMCLATASLSGIPSSRIVLLKGWDANGFLFFTNEGSRKGADLAQNPVAAVTFYWRELERQVNGQGSVERISEEESDLYFATRPRLSQIGAWASKQDAMLSSRDELIDQVAYYRNKFEGGPVPRPRYWRGYRINPSRLEFWQGRESRLHDRFVYVLNNAWALSRLSP
jgi:pyridoxamine 5'-phosphate oxidase